MSNFLDRLNLGPQERRLVVGAVAVLFVLLNTWFVWPHFKDWGRMQAELRTAEDTLAKFEAEVGKLPDYEQKKQKLESADSSVGSSEQALQLQKIVMLDVADIVVVNKSDTPAPRQPPPRWSSASPSTSRASSSSRPARSVIATKAWTNSSSC